MNKQPEVTWFSNNHEHSLHWIKLGLMRLNAGGNIKLRDIPCHLAHGELPGHWVSHHFRRLVAIKVKWDNSSYLVLLDGEDSIFQTSPLILDCDFYFSCAFHRPFFSGAPFSLALPWQSAAELSFYSDYYHRLQNNYRKHLHKAYPLGPIGPELESVQSINWGFQKIRNIRYRLRRLYSPAIDLSYQYKRFEQRMNMLVQLRKVKPIYDVVLRDSLWGWPRHRIALHERLATLSNRYDIRTKLTWRKAEAYELGDEPAPDPYNFPQIAGLAIPSDYEAGLAKSRLGVFATGFHYGCRSITTLAWYLGLRTYVDPLSFDTGADLTGLDIAFNHEGNWPHLDYFLAIAAIEPSQKKEQRQRVFDQELAPEILAKRMLQIITSQTQK